MESVEVNFDGLIGPSHNFAGLAFGNLASTRFAHRPSSPKQGALQGLEKMKLLHQLGVPQGILPPLRRPDFNTLKQLGFSGTHKDIIEQAAATDMALLASCYSASSMWTANAATVTPSVDSQDNRVHFTAANLISQFHRSIEPPATTKMLKAVFGDPRYFCHHPSLPAHPDWADEGAANHTRLCHNNRDKGISIFVYGKAKQSKVMPTTFPARQSLEACQAIARSHGLAPNHTLFLQQAPEAIDQGVFHNDVICVGHQQVLFYHQDAFYDEAELVEFIAQHTQTQPYHLIRVETGQVSLKNAVSSYLFNSQIVINQAGEYVLIAPHNCAINEQVNHYINQLIKDASNPINQVHFVNLDQSMNNGGGPACLRLRVRLTPEEIQATNPNCMFNEDKYLELKACIEQYYPDELTEAKLKDPRLLSQLDLAYTQIGKILGVAELYDH
ncbi:N-succinylarginine dihydrolase [Motilimonas sp. KMU-193]|uniref:N-succinylarginine dihydrolase n=1 Tax=Motilimonas sp. KMU-193 TaxID=3388668 RepID=UPI00396B0DED